MTKGKQQDDDDDSDFDDEWANQDVLRASSRHHGPFNEIFLIKHITIEKVRACPSQIAQ